MKLKTNLIGFVPLFWCAFIINIAAKFSRASVCVCVGDELKMYGSKIIIAKTIINRHLDNL